MQPIVHAPKINHENSRPLRRFGSPLLILMICLLALSAPKTSFAQSTETKPTAPAAQSEAKKAFEKMKTLAGTWQGTIMGISINVTIRIASSRTAILHEAHTGGGKPPDHEITMFYLDGDRLLATHYCDAGNQARFEGKLSSDAKSLEFNFLDVAGNTRGGLVKHIVFTMVDADHHIVEFTFLAPDGKSMELRGEFQRTSPA